MGQTEWYKEQSSEIDVKPLTTEEIFNKHVDHPDGSSESMMEHYAYQQTRIKILECVKIIEQVFLDQHKTLAGRSAEEQNILGNCITVLESDIKNQMKKMI